MRNFLKFWGTRGSCPVSGPEYAKFGGNTSCLEIRYGDAHLIIDAGTGIRPLGEELVKNPHPLHLIFSHTHWDHVIGFPFFAPLYSSKTELTIWSDAPLKNNSPQVFEDLMRIELFPIKFDELKAAFKYSKVENKKPIQIGPLKIDFQLMHHPSAAYGFKIETPHQTIGYASDNELFRGHHGDPKDAPEDPELVRFFSGCDLLIHEAQYFPEEYLHKVGWGHSSISNGVALVQKAKIEHWLVVHHDPKHTDGDLRRMAAMSEKLLRENTISCRSEWIGDGHVVALT